MAYINICCLTWINQSKRIYIAPYVASESEAHVGLVRQSVYVRCTQCQTVSNSSVFRARQKLLKDSADLQLYDGEFQTSNFLQAGCPSCCPTNIVKALKRSIFFTYYTYFIFRDKMCIICVFYHFITGCKVQLNYSANRLTDDPCWEALEGFNWNKPWCLPLTLATKVHTQL